MVTQPFSYLMVLSGSWILEEYLVMCDTLLDPCLSHGSSPAPEITQLGFGCVFLEGMHSL